MSTWMKMCLHESFSPDCKLIYFSYGNSDKQRICCSSILTSALVWMLCFYWQCGEMSQNAAEEVELFWALTKARASSPLVCSTVCAVWSAQQRTALERRKPLKWLVSLRFLSARSRWLRWDKSSHISDWFISVYLKDAYFQIQVAPCHMRFLRYAFEGIAYQFMVLRSYNISIESIDT